MITRCARSESRSLLRLEPFLTLLTRPGGGDGVMEPEVPFNPFPGLRPFEPDEDHLFFGREKQIDELLRRLRTTRFLSVSVV